MRADLAAQVKAKTRLMQDAMYKVGTPHPCGHAFIWGNVPATLKNGSVKYFKVVIGSVCSDDLYGCCAVCEQMGAKNVYYNLD